MFPCLCSQIGVNKRLVKFWSRFNDAIPAAALALFPDDTREIITRDEFGQLRSRVSTQFAVFDAHPQTLLALRRTGLPVFPAETMYTTGRQLFEGALFFRAARLVCAMSWCCCTSARCILLSVSARMSTHG